LLLLKRKSFPPRFASKRKLLNRSEAKHLKRKKVKKVKTKRKNRLEFRFAWLGFEVKITKAKRSEKFEAKRSEKREVKVYSEVAKRM
jgi:hypothetical protein